ncbi:MAG: RagB/SusD family nutrient uptake outer membrane protein [Prolixibacteraceae bacterium]|mgnify:CR=1 FL=1|jgi:starch-binding outer membrane protein, SusD/RagB family|nr:RagB/SusD family nutrient uptake outer membrane protein [Prolixibacteraceae bacterium]MBT7397262.1 RagB/SusD family nutrient uptake outer membrane protein [Prolixibacteraceae bacterium]
MKILNKYKVVIAMLVVLFATSCEDFLKEESISNQLADSYYATEGGFEDLVKACYPLLRDITDQPAGRRLAMIGTDVFGGGTGYNEALTEPGDPLNVYSEAFDAADVDVEMLWDLLYREIGRANTVIDRAEVVEMDESLKATRVGEAKFLRAYCLFIAVQQWGGIPMPLEETTGADKEVERVASATVYSQILTDLTEAETVLPATASNYGRATKGAAQFLLARVYLTRGWNYDNSLGGSAGDFDKAVEYADKVIAAYPLVNGYKNLFPLHSENPLTETFPSQDAKNSEVVFAVQYSDDVLTYMGDVSNSSALEGNSRHSIFGGGAEDIPGTLGRTSDYNRHLGKFHTNPAMYRLFDPVNDSRYDHNFVEALYALQDVPDFIIDDATKIDISKGDTVVYFRAWNDPADLVDKGIDVGGTKMYAVINQDETGLVDNSPFHDNHKTPMMWKFWEPGIPYGDAFGTFDFAVFRSAEAYLIAAEAIVKGASAGSVGGAEDYYNAVLDRAVGAGTNPMQAAVPEDVSSFETVSYRATSSNINVDMILDERARELMGEGMRWYDLKRTGKLIERTNRMNPWTGAKGKLAEKHYLRPIPLHELDRSSSDIQQNNGY